MMTGVFKRIFFVARNREGEGYVLAPVRSLVSRSFFFFCLVTIVANSSK